MTSSKSVGYEAKRVFLRHKLSALAMAGGVLIFPNLAGAECTLSGAGTAASPYLVGTYSDLKQLSAKDGCDPYSSYLLSADIDAAASKGENGGKGFAPIGDSTRVGDFSGDFNGNRHSISNLFIKASSQIHDGVGLFGRTRGKIHQLKLIDAYVEVGLGSGGAGITHAGLIAGLSNGTIDSCTITGGRISVNQIYQSKMPREFRMGGVAGTSTGTIRFCSTSDTVIGPDSSLTGGIAGWSTGLIHSCHSSGLVSSGNKSTVGGIAAYQAQKVDSSSFFGTIKGGVSSMIGGISGSGISIMDSCATTGELFGDSGSSIGGISGSNYGPISRCIASIKVTGGKSSSVGGISGSGSGKISSSIATGIITCDKNSKAGGIIGRSGDIERSYANIQISAGTNSVVGGLAGGSAGIIENCYALGTVTSGDSSRIGGLVGEINGTIRKCYSLISIGGTTNSIRGQIGGAYDTYLMSDKSWNLYWNNQNGGPSSNIARTSPSLYSTHSIALGLTTAQMMDSSNFAGFSFAEDSAWMMLPNSFPALRGMVNATGPEYIEITHKPWVSKGPSLQRMGPAVTLKLEEPAQVRVVDLQGRVILPESRFAAGTHDLNLPRSRRLLFVQVRTETMTTALALGSF